MIAHIFQDQPRCVGGIHSKPVSITLHSATSASNLVRVLSDEVPESPGFPFQIATKPS